MSYSRVASIALCLIGATLAACSSRDAREAIQRVDFRVDTALTGNIFTIDGLGARIALPRGWSDLPASECRRLDSASAAVLGAAMPRCRCVAARTDAAGAALCALSIVDTRDTAVASAMIDMYRRAATSGDARTAVFVTGPFTVHQLLLQRGDLVVWRMIFTAPSMPSSAQLDWYLPRERYPDLVHTVESVSGSLHLQ